MYKIYSVSIPTLIVKNENTGKEARFLALIEMPYELTKKQIKDRVKAAFIRNKREDLWNKYKKDMIIEG